MACKLARKLRVLVYDYKTQVVETNGQRVVNSFLLINIKSENFELASIDKSLKWKFQIWFSQVQTSETWNLCAGSVLFSTFYTIRNANAKLQKGMVATKPKMFFSRFKFMLSWKWLCSCWSFVTKLPSNIVPLAVCWVRTHSRDIPCFLSHMRLPYSRNSVSGNQKKQSTFTQNLLSLRSSFWNVTGYW